jgi:hypothetical protein
MLPIIFVVMNVPVGVRSVCMLYLMNKKEFKPWVASLGSYFSVVFPMPF